MKGFVNCNVYIEGKGVQKCSVGFEDGKIAYIGNDLSGIEPLMELSEEQVVVPGFIDEHIHGAAGCDAMDGTTEALSKVATAIAKEGTVGFLATTMTQSPENIGRAMVAVKDYMAEDHPEGAAVLGLHLEGPFISKKHERKPHQNRFDGTGSGGSRRADFLSVGQWNRGFHRAHRCRV